LVQSDKIDQALEARMEMAQRISSLVLSLRKKVNIRVRQPLSRILLPTGNNAKQMQINLVKELILSETNVKQLEFAEEENTIIVKKVKPDFKALGPKFGKQMKEVAAAILQMSAAQINQLQQEGVISLEAFSAQILLEDVEIVTEDIPGWQVASDGPYTIALDTTITESLFSEGLARELINKIQSLRKTSGLEVTDHIHIFVKNHPLLTPAIESNKNYICAETLGDTLNISNGESFSGGVTVELNDEISTEINIAKI
jgi:isoleucyl-tRNA synthetase